MQRRLQDDNDHQRLRASEQTIIVGGPAQGREAALSTTGAGWRGRSHSIETRVEGSSKLRTDLRTAHTLWMIRLIAALLWDSLDERCIAQQAGESNNEAHM